MPGPRNSILDTIGRTPVVRINKLAPAGIELYAKLEAFNPLGSVKDRLALGIIEAAETSGALKPGQTVVEATSGNTGIGLAMVCAQKGYPLVIVMAESFSVERRKLMRFLGAKVVLTPAAAKGTGMVAKARELAEQHGWFLCRQFENEANPDIHSRTTAQEILRDFEGRRLDYWVTGSGTGGTLRGVGRVLKAHRPGTRIVLCEPDNAPMISSGMGQTYNADGSAAESHPMFRPHLMQGWAPDFIPKLTHDALQAAHVDEVIGINGNDALRLARALATEEGILAGISGGATLAGAIALSQRIPKGSTVLCMIPDTGERYLSTVLFDGVSETMSEAEEEIAASTEGYRMGASSPPAIPTVPTVAAARVVLPEPEPRATQFVDQAIRDPEQPVVMFALEWCEFCWALRKFFRAHGIAYRSVDLDSVAHQQDNRGGEIRKDLHQRLRSPTIPQIFVGGAPIGGCTETLELFRTGELQQRLTACGVAFDAGVTGDPARFLPKWVHPR
jgi:cysteine synthase A